MCNYTLGEFGLLLAEVEDQGGVQEEDLCEGNPIEYPNGGRVDVVQSCACGNRTMFLVPYPGEDPDAEKAHSARLCAVCDGLAWMPRFKHVMPSNFEG